VSYVEIARLQIESELRVGLGCLDWVDANAAHCIRAAVAAARAQQPFASVPDALAEALIVHVRSSSMEARKALQWAKGVVEAAGSPDSLRMAADAIRSAVIAPVEPLADSVTLSHLPSALETNWKDGSASEAYRIAVDGRSTAVERIGDHAASMADALDEQADAIESFYLRLLQFVVSAVVAVGSIVQAVAFVAGVITAPAGIISLTIAAAGAISASIALYEVMVTSEQSARSVRSALSQTVGGWPHPRV
jgi:hypothetical protein